MIGVSLVPALFGTGPIDRQSYFYYRDSFLYAVRNGPYKAHFYTQGGFSDFPPEPVPINLLLIVDSMILLSYII